MPKQSLPQTFNLVKREVTVPGYEGCWVRFRDDVTVGELEVLDNPPDFRTVREILADYIEDWNLPDPKHRGKKLPRPYKKPEVLARLPLKLLYWCIAALTGVALSSPTAPFEEESPSASESGEP